MLRTIKNILLLACSLCLITPVYAEEQNAVSSTEDNSPIVFSLDQAYQEYRYTDEDGLLMIVSVRSSLTGEHTITMQSTGLIMSFKINVNAYDHITSAYGASYHTPYNVQSTTLTVDSLVQATYTVVLDKFGMATSKYLRVNIVSGSLSISHN